MVWFLIKSAAFIILEWCFICFDWSGSDVFFIICCSVLLSLLSLSDFVLTFGKSVSAILLTRIGSEFVVILSVFFCTKFSSFSELEVTSGLLI